MGPLLVLAALIAAALLLIYRLLRSSYGKTLHASTSPAVTGTEKDPYNNIQSLPAEFDWAATPPIKVWPFKPKYHLSMALENIDISSFIEIDNTYRDRMQIRRAVMDEHREATLQCNSVAGPAVLEFYDWMLSTYLPKRFPSIYKPVATPSGPHLHNKFSGTDLPVRPTSPMAALETLGEHVDTDFLFLLPSSTAPDGSPIYHLQAFITCFPAGFSTREKCGKPLAAIHAPVPGYVAKLEKSMDRFFARIEVGKMVRRSNWSISTDDRLFSDGGNHMYADAEQGKPIETNNKTLNVGQPDLDRKIEEQKRDVVVEDCRVRCERQTLHRLQTTGALVFAFKTYLYRLDEVKEEGLGPVLAEAIEGLGKGSVPDMAFYKRGVVWGEKVVAYLNS
ncbi:hypothetical protein LTR35_016330 [Friedmanniomyces endolithicus]|uniref:Uncharacterized protein n=1 Tax=Friedmanniomyces endolithicus TaxID=329885 RepID=A0AAN6G1Y2_9PEZI|nr:hypothetical protein LTR35_016330 [Friedmanniomyces endolithicus]KAK0295708.1 hypothetical protein LTS00_005910 [Friedmanniomyces endolithicus]KAK0326335.1 hypothetical protein LTR82_002175 [Friedmanniomyces endolithicus]KAK0976787.1 hypothetical protein LTR54_016414 [Friedmanniomyces endolithicus]